MEWKPITILTKSRKVGPHRLDAETRVVSVRLASVPPQAWSDQFTYGLGERRLDEPSLEGDVVSICVGKDEEDQGLDKIRERVERTNRMYAMEHAPRKEPGADLSQQLKTARDEGQIEGMMFALNAVRDLLKETNSSKIRVGGLHGPPDPLFQEIKRLIRKLQGR